MHVQGFPLYLLDLGQGVLNFELGTDVRPKFRPPPYNYKTREDANLRPTCMSKPFVSSRALFLNQLVLFNHVKWHK